MKVFYTKMITRLAALTLSLIFGCCFFLAPTNVYALTQKSQTNISVQEGHFDGFQSEVIGKQNFITDSLSKGEFLLAPVETLLPNSSCLSQCYSLICPSTRDTIAIYLSSKSFRI